ncbi:MAG: transglycosylase SLT domain-containing protein [Kutzneria sp.]|nr:transglycosylase SLT domain-containing protein [Kutzneria sp.]MBV9844158.1 transglycosylase SLT domain-containing protein [Kutzneria sp.]
MLAFLGRTPPPPPRGPSGPPPFVVPQLDVRPRAAVPDPASAIPAPEVPVVPPRQTFQGWVTYLSSVTDVPPRVLTAYARATLAIGASAPGCHLSWTTLAAVGRIESRHGRYGGNEVADNGRERKPLIGPTLDGSPGVLAVPDTDRGVLDGDPVWDHAIGPMQFTPQTWRRWGVRVSGDGAEPDPQNVDDASNAAARYLCAVGGDLAVPANWWTAVLSYNNSTEYGQSVFSSAEAYGKVSLGAN